MKKPKMIIFDYGHTLAYEANWNGVKGQAALMEYCVLNKNNLSTEEIAAFADKLFYDTHVGRKNELEFHQHHFGRFLNEYLQVEINLSPLEQEEIFWNNASPANAMPNMEAALDYLEKNNIRTGVISNISFSGKALENRINKILPNHNFEFIIASSEYVFRKPNKLIFELALRKANLEASEVWYCGDSVEFDIAGANSAGVFPVWFESKIECYYKERGESIIPDCEHLHITDWQELIDCLEKLR